MTKSASPLSIAVALSLFVVSFLAVVVAQKDVGIARDEATYMHYGSSYARWWVDLASGKSGMTSEEVITSHFGGVSPTAGNREHPPLMKTLIGLSHQVFYRGLGWTSEVTAYRLPSAAFFALLVVLVYAFARRHFGGAAAGVAAVLLLATPRLFFYASMATFDLPVVTLWFATIFFYDRVLHSGSKPLVLGVVFGLALATKHNALMLPAVIGCHYLWVVYCDVRGAEGGPSATALAFLRGLWSLKPSIFLALFVVGPLVLVAVWPWLWFDTFRHLADWIGFHLSHVHYNYEYLGTNWNAPPFPWHIAIVTVAFTVPLITLTAAGLGAGELVRQFRAGERSEDAPAALLGLSALVAIGPFLLPSTPIFGAEKHYAAVVPTLCVLAGVGICVSARLLVASIGRTGWTQVVTAGLAVLAFLASGAETRAAHPYALSHYTSLAGGPAGAADLGMNRQFWGYAARGVLEELERRSEGRETLVYTHDASPAWQLYRRAGLVVGLRDSGPEERGIRRSKLAIVIHEKHFNRHDYMVWKAYGTVRPVFVLALAGVPLVSLYERPSSQ